MSSKNLCIDWRTAKKRTIREGLGEGLLRVGNDKRVVVLSGNVAHSTRVGVFEERYPERFFEMGVQEQNMMGVAGGMASVGYVVYVASYAVFNPGRNWEQVRLSVAQPNMNVKILGSHGGVASGVLGLTHQATEDIALARVLPNMTVLVPADVVQMRAAVQAAHKIVGPVYIRAVRASTWSLYREEYEFELGKIEVLREVLRQAQDKVQYLTIAACGVMVGQALLMADRLTKQGVEAEVLNVSTVKPLDVETLVESAKKTGRVVTMEDHQVMGGMGSAVAEALSEHYPVPVLRLGVQDKFGVSGEWEEVYREMGLDLVSLEEKILAVLD